MAPIDAQERNILMSANKKEIESKLHFRPDGTYRILMVSDIHAGRSFNRKIGDAMSAMVAHTDPDLVILGGDTASCGRIIHVENEEDLREILDVVCKPMEDAKIPWCHVFGNHDDNFGYSTAEQEKVYESYPCCVSQAGPEDIDGQANYVVPILASDRSHIAFNVWGLDSHRTTADLVRDCSLPEDTKIVMFNHLWNGSTWDMPHFNQVSWYFQTSLAMEKANGGRKIPALMVLHIPIPEMLLAFRNRRDCAVRGRCREGVNSGEFNSGLFAACVQRGDVKAMFFGHDHINDCTATYCGILMGYDAALTYDGYIDDDIRGARVFELDENKPGVIQTHMVYTRDLNF